MNNGTTFPGSAIIHYCYTLRDVFAAAFYLTELHVVIKRKTTSVVIEVAPHVVRFAKEDHRWLKSVFLKIK